LCCLSLVIYFTFGVLSLFSRFGPWNLSVFDLLLIDQEHLLNLCCANLFWIFRRSTGSTTSDHSGDRVPDEDVPEDQGLSVDD
jgi:hypothetical protein